MRLCFIADGRSLHAQQWTEHFGKRHEVHLITYDPPGRVLEGVTVHVIGSRFRNLYLSFWPRHIRIRELIRKIDPDIVHALFVTKYGFHLPLRGKWPTIVSALGDDILVLPRRSFLIRAFTGRVLQGADLVYAVSRDIGERIVKDYGVDPGKVLHRPIGIDTAVFSPGGRERTEGGALILFSNRGFLPVYDNRTLVEGFAAAWRENPRLSLILKGDGPEEGELRRLAGSLGLSEAISFRPRSPRGDIPADLREADIFISTAVSDGTPVSLLEAMSAALPCIATRVGGVPEWIEDGVNGLLIRPGDARGLARAILTLAGDPALRARFGARARDSVIGRGEWNRLMVQVEDDYGRLIDRRGGGP